jgi:hypothetical protein
MIIYELGPIDVWFGWIPFNKVIAIAAWPIDRRVDWFPYSTDHLRERLADA